MIPIPVDTVNRIVPWKIERKTLAADLVRPFVRLLARWYRLVWLKTIVVIIQIEFGIRPTTASGRFEVEPLARMVITTLSTITRNIIIIIISTMIATIHT